MLLTYVKHFSCRVSPRWRNVPKSSSLVRMIEATVSDQRDRKMPSHFDLCWILTWFMSSRWHFDHKRSICCLSNLQCKLIAKWSNNVSRSGFWTRPQKIALLRACSREGPHRCRYRPGASTTRLAQDAFNNVRVLRINILFDWSCSYKLSKVFVSQNRAVLWFNEF
jgi:hypothetical protein